MAIIDKIRLSGTTYDIVDQSKAKVIEVTQQQYDAIVTPEANAIYVITDAPSIDISDFYNKATINGMMALKQDVLVSGTNIKTINNESILGSGNITIQGGGSVTIDPSLNSGSTNAVANSAITAAIDAVNDSLSGKQDTLLFYTEEDNTQEGSKDARIETTIEDTENGITKSAYVESLVNDTTPFAEINAHTEVNNNEESYQRNADIYADDGGVYLSYQTQDDIEQTNYNAQLNINGDGISLNVDNEEDSVSLNVTADGISLNVYDGVGNAAEINVTAEGVTINDDPVVTESMLSGKADTSAVTAVSDALSGKVNTSAVTSSVTSGSTDVVTSGGVYEQMGGLSLYRCTQAQYDAIVTKNPNVLYIIS